jgi:Cof subfamily protein (haloacid dehalogenase superfamily)
MLIRLIAIDLDGTLLNSRAEVSSANRQALLAATARGVEVAVVTGRRSHSARKFLDQIPCPVTLISSNGALITSASGEAVYRNFLPRSAAQQVLEATRDYRPYVAVLFDVSGRGQVMTQSGAVSTGPLGWYLTQSPDCLEQVPELEVVLATDPVQILFGGPPASIEPVAPLLAASPAGASVHLTWTKYLTRNISLLDVMNRSCSKGSALAFWAQHCGIAPSEVMAIGDNFNDLEMLQFAAVPVVMANSTPGLARADWRVTLSNEEDGVAAAVQSYVLP